MCNTYNSYTYNVQYFYAWDQGDTALLFEILLRHVTF